MRPEVDFSQAEPVELDVLQGTGPDSDRLDDSDVSPARDDLDPPDVIIDQDDDSRVRGIIEQGLIPAAIVSVVFHLWLVSSLATVIIENPESLYVPEIVTRMVEFDPDVPPPEEVVEFDLANPKDEDHELHEAINARSVGTALSRDPHLESAPIVVLDDLNPIPEHKIYDVPEGLELDDRIVIKGTTGEAAIQLEAALDRVTWEIANNLQERKVLAVWLIDGSASLIEQRKIITKRMKRIYGELQALDQSGQIPRHDQPLLSAVVSFGEKTSFITPEPTADLQQIIDAIDRAPTDSSGKENVFGAVELVLKRWLDYRTKHGRRIMLLTVTDEAGDDFEHLESAIVIAKRYGARAYVIGPSAVFGRRQGFVPYVHPKDGKTYQLPVDIGPETAVAENVQLPFWFSGPQHEYISAGIGPYGLSRLVNETGGVYFMTNMMTNSGLAPTGTFYTDDMKPFEPDYRFGNFQDYLKDLSKHPLRRAVVEAADKSLKYKAKGTPMLEFRVTQTNFLQTLSTAQQTVAESTLMIDNVLQSFQGNLEPEYQKETSSRWRAAYNLSLGRLLAQKVRCYEYNFACAQMKQMGAQDVATKSNHWIFRPDTNLNYAATFKKQAAESERLLRRVLKEAPGTPWAALAARELKDPFGIKIIQQFDPPPPPPSQAKANGKKGIQLANDKKPAPAPKPAPPPPPPVLPKL